MGVILPLSLLLTLAGLTACGTESPVEHVVAEVGNAKLTMAELIARTPVANTPEDSAVFANEFISAWTRRQVLLQKAEFYLASETEDIERAVEEYRSSLIIETYQNKLIEQKFKPDITEQQVVDYYNANKRNFILHMPLIKGVYAVIPNTSPDIKGFVKSLTSNKEESSLAVEQYLYKNSSNYKISTDNWIALPSVLKFFPANSVSSDVRGLMANKVIQVSDSLNVYILRVTDAYREGAVAPIEYVNKDIYNILLGKRKLEFLSSANKEIYDQAIKDNIIKYHDK